MWCLALGLLLAIERDAELPPAAAAPPEAGVVAILAADPELQRHHTGYLAYLHRNPAMAKAEQDLLALMRLPSVYPALVNFDEALHADPAAEGRFDRHYDRLARDPVLRRAVESAYRLDFDARGTPALAEPLAFLRANPDLAMRFLQRPESLRPMPEALYKALNELRDRPQLLSELGGAFEVLLGQPGGRTDVLPWWSGITPAVAPPFLDQPHRFWVWHQRHLAFAEDAQARAWARWWLRKTRRVDGLGYAYLSHLGAQLDRPAPAPEAADAWPPAPAPPELPRLQHDDLAVPTPRTEGARPVRPDKPEKPTVTRPEVPRPARPTLPDRPTMPVKPEAKRPESTPARP